MAIRRAARAAHPQEACGLLFGRHGADGWWIGEASVAANVAADPARRFEVDPAHLFAVQRAAREGGPAPVGVWHSHPDGRPEPSAMDRDGVTDARWLWLIVAGEAMAAFVPDGGGFRAVGLAEVSLDSD